MSTNSVALTNLNTGEVYETDIKLPDNRYTIKGYKMYQNGVKALIDILTKTELKLVIDMYGVHSVDYNNILTKGFKEFTKDMADSTRSRFKRKLIDNGIIGEYKKKIMLSPYIFLPKGDKNIRNCNHLTQRVFKYVFMDADTGSEEVIEHAEKIFGNFDKSEFLHVGSQEDGKFIELPQHNDQ